MDLSLETDLIRKKLSVLQGLEKQLFDFFELDFYEEVFPSDPDGLIYENITQLIEEYTYEVYKLDLDRLEEYNRYIEENRHSCLKP